MGVELRPGTAADAAAIARVHVASWQAAYRGQLPDSFLDSLSVERRTAGWIASFEDGSVGRVVVADRDGVLVGFATVGSARGDDVDDSVGELYAIYTVPEVWDTGVGTSLHTEALALLATEYATAVLWVLHTNDRARRFYERHGWTFDGAEKTEQVGEVDLVEVRYRRAV